MQKVVTHTQYILKNCIVMDTIKEPGFLIAGGSLTARDVNQMSSAADAANKLRYLKLERNKLGTNPAAAIGKPFDKYLTFQKFWRHIFTRCPKGLEHLGNGLMLSPDQLTVMDCSGYSLGPNGMIGLQAILSNKVCFSLRELHLNKCSIGMSGGVIVAKSVLDCYRKSFGAGTPLNLKVFAAGFNYLGEEGTMSISVIFCTLTTLEEITMSHNLIGDKGITALCKGFKNNPNMLVLNLYGNNITPNGAFALANGIISMPRLRRINFGNCNLKTKGACSLANALKNNHLDLETLILESNGIGPEGGLSLAAALKNKTKLKLLRLDLNKLGHNCIKKIIEMLPNNFVNASFYGDLGQDEDDNNVTTISNARQNTVIMVDSPNDKENAIITNDIPEPNKKRNIDLLQKSNDNLIPPRDEDQIFGDYVASVLRTSSNKNNNKRLKLKIQRSILEIQETEDDGDDDTENFQ